MRKCLHVMLIALFLMGGVAAPAWAQEPPTGAPPIYLPLVTDGKEEPAADEVIMLEGALVLGEEPAFDVPPKANTTPDPQPVPDPDDPGPDEPKADATTPTAGEMGVESVTPDGWATLLNDGMESNPWPLAPLWRIFDGNGATNGTYYWNDENDKPYRGGWSAWPAGNVLDGSGNYAPNMRSWMVYGPFSLADAAQATLTFQYWTQTELNYDWFGFFASPDGSRFYGNWITGNSPTWRPGVIDFAHVPGYGSMLGDGSVWIAFYFHSDSNTQLRGTFVDDIFVQKFNCPGQLTGYWYNSLTQNSYTQRAVTCESYPFSRNWGTTGPTVLFGQGDNWSLFLTGRVYFNTSKTWVFSARSDDGVAVWVDGVKVIDAYYDQGAITTHTATRYLTQGTHTVWVQYYERTGAAQLHVSWY